MQVAIYFVLFAKWFCFVVWGGLTVISYKLQVISYKYHEGMASVLEHFLQEWHFGGYAQALFAQLV